MADDNIPPKRKFRNDLTSERAIKEFLYVPETGALYRNAGNRHSSGYLTVSVGGRNYPVHRVAWLIMTGEWPKHEIDHINGIRDDNRFENLREATPQQNSFNRKTRSDNKYGHVGVSFYKRNQKWGAYIDYRIDWKKKRKFLGLFQTKEEAIEARIKASIEMHGEFAKYR